jgi:hypothetical protein
VVKPLNLWWLVSTKLRLEKRNKFSTFKILEDSEIKGSLSDKDKASNLKELIERLMQQQQTQEREICDKNGGRGKQCDQGSML